eukprot:4970601-Alexandrium_andersonii.AAC.1
MSASLVGSEMCIRDRYAFEPGTARAKDWPQDWYPKLQRGSFSAALRAAVSYTHLTLPTICSV